jgi:hypothetical protein
MIVTLYTQWVLHPGKVQQQRSLNGLANATPQFERAATVGVIVVIVLMSIIIGRAVMEGRLRPACWPAPLSGRAPSLSPKPPCPLFIANPSS